MLASPPNRLPPTHPPSVALYIYSRARHRRTGRGGGPATTGLAAPTGRARSSIHYVKYNTRQ